MKARQPSSDHSLCSVLLGGCSHPPLPLGLPLGSAAAGACAPHPSALRVGHALPKKGGVHRRKQRVIRGHLWREWGGGQGEQQQEDGGGRAVLGAYTHDSTDIHVATSA